VDPIQVITGTASMSGFNDSWKEGRKEGRKGKTEIARI